MPKIGVMAAEFISKNSRQRCRYRILAEIGPRRSQPATGKIINGAKQLIKNKRKSFGKRGGGQREIPGDKSSTGTVMSFSRS